MVTGFLNLITDRGIGEIFTQNGILKDELLCIYAVL